MLLLLRILALLGVLALLLQAGRAAFALVRGGVDMFVAKDLHEVRSQRGDLTGMQEAIDLRRVGRRRRAAGIARLSFWVGLLIIPSFTPWALQMRAACAAFWLWPRPRGGVQIRTSFRSSVIK
jgi:hypothetical protein